ncbi:MAG: YdcH family protein [Rhodospirillales bacterium]|nr:YdcH family protein [Rhodospirillales bacterium]
MEPQSRFLALKARHEKLEEAIDEERNRASPNPMLVQMLKRQKLRVKEKLHQMPTV